MEVLSSGFHLTSVISLVIYLCVFLLISCIVLFFLVVLHQGWKFRHIPGPKRSSVIYGCLQEVREFLEKGNNKLDLLMKWQAEYGTVFRYSILHRYIIVALDPDVVKEILGKPSVHWKPYVPYGIMGTLLGNRFMGNGLITEANHARWKIHRAMLNPAFNRKYLMTMVETFNDHADHLVSYLTDRADGSQEVSMYDAFNNATLDIIAKAGFGLELNVLDDPNNPFPNAILTCLNTIQSCIQNPWMKYGLTSKVKKAKSEVKDACDLLRRVGKDCVENRLAAKARGEELPLDMLTNILEASKDLKGDENFGIEEMLDEFATFFIAGQETTSNVMSFTLEQLGKNPRVLQKVQVELDEKIGGQTFISFHDMGKLEYLNLVLKEALRMYAPASIVNRVTGTDVKASTGIVIPKGSQVSLSPFVMGRMAKYYKDPLIFRPERFIESKHSPYAYFPFGYGQRSCIGQQFALIESRIIMAKLLQKLKFDLVPGQSWNISFAVTIRPVDGCKNFVSLRH
ncbi:cholesterol 24-hydroxylase-like [Lytechinus pictus]|uniref:cholesterol 24-hydroxylase-like n=1 Tax=Lytechinus pictus TaxID=7653 RepID=UPI0030BA06FE